MHVSSHTVPGQGLFSSKANTLEALRGYEELNIPESLSFTVSRWTGDQAGVCEDIGRAFAQLPLAVRSSCRREDGLEQSSAGAFASVLHVPSDDAAILARAVASVIASYGEVDSQDQVLVQPMVRDIVVSGVIMTRVLNDGAPYYVINYDDESGRADAVTGGTGVSKTVFVFRGVKDRDFDSSRLRSFVALARRVEEICGNDSLDMEFCLDAAGRLHLLQVRPICAQAGWVAEAEAGVQRNIAFVSDFITERVGQWPALYGERTILGVMPDWNPAEMIGITPRLLASSLYRELITRRVWSQAREAMGYRGMPPEELMLLVAGRPYIDVRTSFNSFIPAGLDSVTGETLVSAWLDRLDTHPYLHDKVEFDVAQTVLDFCFDRFLDTRYPGLLTNARREEFRSRLRALTLSCLQGGGAGTMDKAFEAITELRNRQYSRVLVDAKSVPEKSQILPRIVLLLEECRQYGTLPFSILARHAFIAEALLRSAVERGALLPERLAAFKKSIRTVAGEMSHDFHAVYHGNMDKKQFLRRYGHLRPSTYDILSPRYADRKSLFAEQDGATATEELPSFAFTNEEQRALSRLLADADLKKVQPARLEAYARQAIAGRELGKFVFTRNLSDVLELLAAWGNSMNLGREDISFLDIRDCIEWTTQALLRSPCAHFSELAATGRQLFDLGRSLKLGYLIRSPRDAYIIPQHRSTPNFIGQGKVEAELARLYPDTPCDVDIRGRIVCIENADPGYDWIFTRGVAGLVTLYGGANSHMAIRCAEYGLPAAIGVGEKTFELLTAAKRCLLNAASCILQPL